MRTFLAAIMLCLAPTAEEGSVSGVVKLRDPAPRPKRETDMDGDPKCKCLYEKLPIKEDLVVSAEGGVKWAFVYVKKGLEGKSFPVPAAPVLLDQKGCVYQPRVFGVMVGQALNVRNSDTMLHNVHGLPFANKEFNLAQALEGQVDTVKFTQPEVPVMIKCDVHAWMRTWACVLPHPFYAVTGPDGAFAIKGLPAGKYTLGIWQERCRAMELEVEVKPGETKVGDLLLDLKKE